MGAATNNDPIAPLSNVDAAGGSPLRQCGGPDRPPASAVVQRQMLRTGAFGSPVRRSPRLSCLPPPQQQMNYQDSQDLDESSDDGSESVDDNLARISREETPENDIHLPDEPSTVLANRIIRAHDNPSPPPRDLTHSGIDYVPGKDGQFPFSGVSAPPSPFRPINLLERLNNFSYSSFDSSSDPRTPGLGDRPETPRPDIIPPRGFILPESPSPSATLVPSKGAPHEDLVSADMIPLSSTQCTVDDPPPSLQPVCEPAYIIGDAGVDPVSHPVAGLHGQSMAATSSLDSKASTSCPTQAADSSSNPLVPSTSDDRSPHSGQPGCCQSSPLAFNVRTLSPSLPQEGSPASEVMVPGGHDNGGGEISSMDQNKVPISREEQESQSKMTSTKGVHADPHQKLDYLSPRSSNVLAGLCLPSGSTSSIGSTFLSGDSLPAQHPPVTLFRTPKSFVTHSNLSRPTIRRPVAASTPVRAINSAQRLDSLTKFPLEADDIHRTPAQRVPIETALARGISSFKRTAQTPIGSDQSQPGRFLTIRAPIFKHPALDDPSRSPARRVPITDLVASPTKGDPIPASPTRLGLRARSVSVEPHPLRPILVRSQSVEPRALSSKPDNHGKTKESIFPMVPMFPRSGTKLPFPLVPNQKSSSDLPPPIPEENKTTETGNTEAETTLRSTMSQLRQPSVTSRIPRAGNKPYSRPLPKNGKTATDTTTTSAVRATRAPPFQLAYKNNGVGNSDTEASSTRPANEQHPVGLLKRKRGAEVTAPSNSHPFMIRQVVPGILSGKYAPNPTKFLTHAPESSPPKVPQPLKFRKVVDGMLSARYPPAKTKLAPPESSDSASRPLSPLSELSSSSNEGPPDEKAAHQVIHPESETSDIPIPRTDGDVSVIGPSTRQRSSLHQGAGADEPSSRPRRTSRARRPAQQQYVVDVFGSNSSTRPPPARRKPHSRTEGDGFMGMSATALKVLTASNTTKNQQTVAVLATEVIRKEGLRPESPTVKARTIIQKQRDERDTRRRERAQKKARMSEEGLGAGDMEGQGELRDRVGGRTDHDENDHAMPPKHHWGPGDEEGYETPERPERLIVPLRLDGVDIKVKPVKQVKWHRGLSTAVYLDEVDPRPKRLPRDVVVVRGCLAPTSKDLPLDPLGNLIGIDNRPSPELVSERIIVKRYLYDNDVEAEPVPSKMTRSKSKKGRS